MATRPQIAMIHTLKSSLGMSDDEYHVMLGGFGVSSSKDLKVSAAKDVIEALMKRSGGAAYTPPAARERQPVQLYRLPSAAQQKQAGPPAYVPPCATDKQVAKIRAMWDMVSRIDDRADRARALNGFIEKRFRVSHVNWLPRSDVGKVIHTLAAMIQSKQKEVKSA